MQATMSSNEDSKETEDVCFSGLLELAKQKHGGL